LYTNPDPYPKSTRNRIGKRTFSTEFKKKFLKVQRWHSKNPGM